MRQKTKASLITIGAALFVGALYSSVAISRPIGPGALGGCGTVAVMGRSDRLVTWRVPIR